MKTRILEALRAKFEGVSDLYLEGLASSLAKKTKEDELESAIEGVTFDRLLEHYGDTRATSAYQKAEEKVRRELEPKPENEPKPGAEAKGAEHLEKLIQEAVAKATGEIQRQLKETQAEGLRRERQEAFDRVMKTCRNTTIQEMKSRDFGRMSFETAEEFDAYLGELTKDVEALNRQMAQADLLGMHQPLGITGGQPASMELGAEAIKAMVSDINR